MKNFLILVFRMNIILKQFFLSFHKKKTNLEKKIQISFPEQGSQKIYTKSFYEKNFGKKFLNEFFWKKNWKKT